MFGAATIYYEHQTYFYHSSLSFLEYHLYGTKL